MDVKKNKKLIGKQKKVPFPYVAPLTWTGKAKGPLKKSA